MNRTPDPRVGEATDAGSVTPSVGVPPREFFALEEVATLEAVCARIFPDDEQNRGARRASVVDFLDHMLATGYVLLQSAYRAGLHRLNHLAHSQCGRSFALLNEFEQDTLLRRVECGDVPGWGQAAEFFAMVRMHTIEGVFADDKYKGLIPRREHAD